MSSKVRKGIAFIDGASRGNPGPASLGVILQDALGKDIKSLSVNIGVATNNTAEYYALIFALQEAILLGLDDLEIYTDSELVARQFGGQYKIKEASLKTLWTLVAHLRQGFKKLTVTHIPREKNRLADAAANKALDQQFLF